VRVPERGGGAGCGTLALRCGDAAPSRAGATARCARERRRCRKRWLRCARRWARRTRASQAARRSSAWPGRSGPGRRARAGAGASPCPARSRAPRWASRASGVGAQGAGEGPGYIGPVSIPGSPSLGRGGARSALAESARAAADASGAGEAGASVDVLRRLSNGLAAARAELEGEQAEAAPAPAPRVPRRDRSVLPPPARLPRGVVFRLLPGSPAGGAARRGSRPVTRREPHVRAQVSRLRAVDREVAAARAQAAAHAAALQLMRGDTEVRRRAGRYRPRERKRGDACADRRPISTG
jgi:hypothetical protein